MDRDLLILAQWFSPSFPVGAFAYSQGLEQAIADGVVSGPEDLADWLRDLLVHGAGRTDAILIRCAAGCEDGALEELDGIARALAPASERLFETVTMGTSFGATAAEAWGVPDPAACYPVALGHACRVLGVSVDLAVLHTLLATAGNLVSAAQRLMPLGQTRAQAILADLHEACHSVAQETRTAGIDDLATAGFAADIASMRHETLQPRIFRS